MLVQYALLYYCRSKNVVIFSKVKDRYILWLILTSLILALSSTAIFGLFIIHTLYWLFSAWSLKKILKLSVFLVVIGLFTFVLYSKFEIIAQALDAFVFNKFISGSFESRLGAGYSAAEVFLRHPLIGVGFGILPPADLILVILVGSGVLGGFVFLAMIIVVTYNGYRNPVKFGRFHNSTNILNKANQRIVIISNALTFSFIILIIIYQATGFSFRFGDFWSLAALVVAASNIRDKIV
jgi:O-antigen ligase